MKIVSKSCLILTESSQPGIWSVSKTDDQNSVVGQVYPIYILTLDRMEQI